MRPRLSGYPPLTFAGRSAQRGALPLFELLRPDRHEAYLTLRVLLAIDALIQQMVRDAGDFDHLVARGKGAQRRHERTSTRGPRFNACRSTTFLQYLFCDALDTLDTSWSNQETQNNVYVGQLLLYNEPHESESITRIS